MRIKHLFMYSNYMHVRQEGNSNCFIVLTFFRTCKRYHFAIRGRNLPIGTRNLCVFLKVAVYRVSSLHKKFREANANSGIFW